LISPTTWTFRLIIANVFVFILCLALPDLNRLLAFTPAYVLHRPWTVVSYMFVHAGIGHIFFNMLGLFFFGPRVETELGESSFLWLYFISGITGAACSALFSPYAAVVGASGAVFGVLMAYAYFWPTDHIYIYFILPLQVRWFVVGYALLSLYYGFTGEGGDIAHFAHLGGFLGAYIYLKLNTHKVVKAEAAKYAVPVPTSDQIRRWHSVNRESMHPVNREEYDRVMMKIQTGGLEALTANEINFLDRFSM
jgi:membrane associated rhomboid family serine protease